MLDEIERELTALIERIEHNVRAHDFEPDDDANTAVVTLGTLRHWRDTLRRVE